MKSFLLSWGSIILFVAIAIYVYQAGSATAFWRVVIGGALLLVASGILWFVIMVKYDKEDNRVNKEYDQYEKEAEQALTSEIEAVKGNSLKKELVKRRLVREYIEKTHPEASRRVNDSKFDGLYCWLDVFLSGGLIFIFPLLFFFLVVATTDIAYSISPWYYIVATAVFAVVAVATTIWKRYYVLTLVAVTLAAISVFGICTVGANNVLQSAYYMMIECVDSKFLHHFGWHKLIMCCSFLLVTMFSFCLMTYPLIKGWAVFLYGYVFIVWVGLPLNINFIIWKIYIVYKAIVADFAVMLGMSYAATHILLFVYMLSLFAVLSALPAFFRAWRACRRQDEKARANKQYTEKCERVFRKCMAWLIVNIVAMVLLWSSFIGFSFTDAQMIIEDECEKIANFTGLYYALVYIIVLVVLPLLSIQGSISFYNYTRKQIK